MWLCTLILMLPTLLMPSGMCVCQLLRKIESQPPYQSTSNEESKSCCSRCSAKSCEHAKNRNPSPRQDRSLEVIEKPGQVPPLSPCCEVAATHHLANFSDADLTAFAELHLLERSRIDDFSLAPSCRQASVASPPFAILPHHVCRILLI